MEGGKSKMASDDEWILVGKGKEHNTVTTNGMPKTELSNEKTPATEDQNGVDTGEAKIKNLNLATNDEETGDQAIEKISTTRKQKEETCNWISFQCRFFLLTATTILAWCTSFRSFGGCVAVTLFYTIFWFFFYATYRFSQIEKKHTNYIHLYVYAIKISGYLIACSGPVVLLEGILRRPFVFGGAAALFTTCSWTIILTTLYFLLTMKHCSLHSSIREAVASRV